MKGKQSSFVLEEDVQGADTEHQKESRRARAFDEGGLEEKVFSKIRQDGNLMEITTKRMLEERKRRGGLGATERLYKTSRGGNANTRELLSLKRKNGEIRHHQGSLSLSN